MASWVVQNKLFSNNVVWMIQIPRLYQVYKEQGLLANFQEMLDNIFVPLFEVTENPNSHPHLHMFLKLVVGFDMVDDEVRGWDHGAQPCRGAGGGGGETPPGPGRVPASVHEPRPPAALPSEPLSPSRTRARSPAPSGARPSRCGCRPSGTASTTPPTPTTPTTCTPTCTR